MSDKSHKDTNRKLAERATEITVLAKELNQGIGRSYMALGKLYHEIRCGHPALYKAIGFKTYEAWLAEVGDHEASHAYELTRIYLEVKDCGLPEDVAVKMTLGNAKDFLKLPESKRTAEVAKAATEQTRRQFRDTLEKVQPGLHLEKTDYIGFQVDAEALRSVIRPALECIMVSEELKTRGEALESLCKDWLDCHPDRPVFDSKEKEARVN